MIRSDSREVLLWRSCWSTLRFCWLTLRFCWLTALHRTRSVLRGDAGLPTRSSG